MHTSRFPIFALVGKAKAKAEWRQRFENRSLADRKDAKKVEVRALSNDTTEIMVYDEIGYFGITAQDFTSQLAAITTGSIVVRINSPGGDVFDGLAIYNALKAHPANVTTQVDGWAASAASFIAMAGDTVTMAPNAFLMIHKAWSITVGNADDMRDTAAVLDKIDGQLAAIYAKKTGTATDAIMQQMAGETWFTADEALAGNFINSILDPDAGDGTGSDDAQLDAKQTERVKAMRRRLAIAEHD